MFLRYFCVEMRALIRHTARKLKCNTSSLYLFIKLELSKVSVRELFKVMRASAVLKHLLIFSKNCLYVRNWQFAMWLKIEDLIYIFNFLDSFCNFTTFIHSISNAGLPEVFWKKKFDEENRVEFFSLQFSKSLGKAVFQSNLDNHILYPDDYLGQLSNIYDGAFCENIYTSGVQFF